MIDTFKEYEPVLVHFGDRHSVPAEVCGTCSDADDGVWVPVTMCPDASADQLPEGALCPNTIVLPPKCTACGRRSHMDRWEDQRGTGWQCHAMDCLNQTVDGEIE